MEINESSLSLSLCRIILLSESHALQVEGKYCAFDFRLALLVYSTDVLCCLKIAVSHQCA